MTIIFFHANPISLRFQPGDFWPPEMRVCVSMYWRLSQGVKSLFQPLVWNHFSDPWGWKHFSVPGTETVSKWFHPRDGKAASLFYSKSSNIHPPLTGITQGVKLADELGCHLLYEKNIPRFKFPPLPNWRRRGFEPGTFWLLNRCLSQLIYRGLVENLMVRESIYLIKSPNQKH